MEVTVRKVFFKDEEGFTTAGAAVALLLVFAVAFAGMRVFWVGTRSGDIQYVADAGALAADNAVAEFVTMGQVVDAALLSLSLLELSTYIVSAVAAFIPGGQGVAVRFMEVGQKVQKARKAAAKSAVKGLNVAQKVLPLVCAARANACIKANTAAGGAAYSGFAVPFPLKGVDYELPDTSAVDEAAQTVEDEEKQVNERASEQQKLQEELDDAKRKAWEADCGKQGMNMRERAGHLAGLSGASNPNYSSPETWMFSAALERAKAYYRARYESEPGASAGGSPELVGESVAREHFYAYALATVSTGYVATSSEGAEMPHFATLARNTEQIRATSLYTEQAYPLSSDGKKTTLHAYVGCPEYQKQAPAGTGAVDAIDSGSVHKCASCNYSATTLGRVPAPSTSIDNGFEYYYRTVAEEANKYNAARDRLEEVQKDLDKSYKSMYKAIAKGFKALVTRYDPQPPGRYGCICVVYAPEAQGPSSPFTQGTAKVGQRVAVSGASLAADPASNQGNIVSEIGENLIPEDAVGSGVAKGVFGAWGSALQVYSDGNEGVGTVLNKTLGALPLVGTELSEWASTGFRNAVHDAGLEPAKLQTYKPVLVNTEHIAAQDGGSVAQAFLKLKTAGQAYGDVSMGDFQALAQTFELPTDFEDLVTSAGLLLLKIPLSESGLGVKDAELRLSMPADIAQQYAGAAQGAGG